MTEDQYFLYGTSAVVFHHDLEGGLSAFVVREGQQRFELDNRLLSAIEFDQHDDAIPLSQKEFLALLKKMRVGPNRIWSELNRGSNGISGFTENVYWVSDINQSSEEPLQLFKMKNSFSFLFNTVNGFDPSKIQILEDEIVEGFLVESKGIQTHVAKATRRSNKFASKN